MPLSRRSFVRTLGVGGASLLASDFVAARGREAWAATGAGAPRHAASLILLDSNENPNGPAPAALGAMRAAFEASSRYPVTPEVELREAIARHHGVRTQEVLLGCGSGEVLRYVTEAYVSSQRHLVTAAPTFENPAYYARRVGAEVRDVRVDASLRLDLDGMVRESAGAGLVFFCNPNNPTGTAHGGDDTRAFIRRVHERSPDTTVLVDEAYFEYVELPSYRSMIPLAVRHPRVIVARTFSKIHGMAGLRVGYAIAHADTVAWLEPWRLVSGVNALAAVAARTSLGLAAHVQREASLNRAARDFTVRTFQEWGFPCVPSHTNFVMVDIRRDVREFQATCYERGVAVGRPFPPLTTHLRLTIGTMAEMQRALETIGDVLHVPRESRRG